MSDDIYVIRELPEKHFWCEKVSKITDNNHYTILAYMYEKALEEGVKKLGEIVQVNGYRLCITPADSIKDAIRIYEEQLYGSRKDEQNE